MTRFDSPAPFNSSEIGPVGSCPNTFAAAQIASPMFASGHLCRFNFCRLKRNSGSERHWIVELECEHKAGAFQPPSGHSIEKTYSYGRVMQHEFQMHRPAVLTKILLRLSRREGRFDSWNNRIVYKPSLVWLCSPCSSQRLCDGWWYSKTISLQKKKFFCDLCDHLKNVIMNPKRFKNLILHETSFFCFWLPKNQKKKKQLKKLQIKCIVIIFYTKEHFWTSTFCILLGDPGRIAKTVSI